MRKVEILAPAGSYESLKGAINGGCDAVYLGGSKFGARAFAQNLDEETMLRAIDYVHLFKIGNGNHMPPFGLVVVFPKGNGKSISYQVNQVGMKGDLYDFFD